MQAHKIGLLGGALCALLFVGAARAQETQGTPPQGQGQEGDITSNAEGDRANRLTLKLKDRDLRDVIASIRRKANVNIIMDPAIETPPVSIDLQDVHWRQALDLVAEQAECVVVDLDNGVLKIEKPPRVFFSFENTDIQKVVDTIAKISNANIIVSPDVRGNITLRLKNVPWRDALETAVKTLGFVVVEEARGILRVVPASAISLDLQVEQVQLRYLRPKSMYTPFLQSEYVYNKSPQQKLGKGEMQFTLLDSLRRALTKDVGTLDYFEEVNALVIKDTRPVVEAIKKIIAYLDVEPAQVFLDVMFVTTTNEDVLDVGVSPGGDGWTAAMSLGQIPHRLPFDLGAGGWDDSIIANDSGVGPFTDPTLNGGANTVIPDVVFGALDFTQVSASLRLLKKDSRSEIQQAPKVVALDHQTATIFVGEAVRYAQAQTEQGQAGGLNLSIVEGDDSPVNVGFQLLATPHVIPGTDKIHLEVIPQRTALTGTGSSQLAPAGFDEFTVGASGASGSIALPRVGSSTIATQVLLRSGQTAVLGGLKSKNETDTETKIPLLGDIPVLGWLFKEKSTSSIESTLIVYITPSLIRSAEDTDRQMKDILKEKLEVRNALMEQRSEIFGEKKGG